MADDLTDDILNQEKGTVVFFEPSRLPTSCSSGLLSRLVPYSAANRREAAAGLVAASTVGCS